MLVAGSPELLHRASERVETLRRDALREPPVRALAATLSIIGRVISAVDARRNRGLHAHAASSGTGGNARLHQRYSSTKFARAKMSNLPSANTEA